MDCEITLSSTGKYIIVRPLVPMTVKVGRECGVHLVVMHDKHHINKFLFDMRESPNREKTHANYEFARETLPEFNFPKDSYSAFLVHPEDHSHDFITTAFESAGYNVCLFIEKEMALKWLEVKGG